MATPRTVAPRTARPKPQDHLPSAAVKAARAEALGDDITFDFNGDTYTIPPGDDWDMTVLDHLANNAPQLALLSVLGDEQYTAFRAKNQKMKALTDMWNAVNVAGGTGN